VVEANTGCWIWVKGRTGIGYGKIDVHGKAEGAHRFSYEQFVGPIPAGMHVCHHCDNRACVNPEHLFLGTPASNVADMIGKGRKKHGEQTAASKLTDADVIEIRRRYAERGETQSALAREFGVSQVNVCRIVNRKSWTHLPD
jgi:hypothetical protein